MDAVTSNGLLGVAVLAAFVAFGIILPFYVIKPQKRAGIANGDGGAVSALAADCDNGSAGGACEGGGGADGGGGGGD